MKSEEANLIALRRDAHRLFNSACHVSQNSGNVPVLQVFGFNFHPGGEVCRSIMLAKMWLGKALGELGAATPYPKADDPSSSRIEPQAESTDDLAFVLTNDKVADIKRLRVHIEELSLRVKLETGRPYDTHAAYAAHCYLIEAKMFCGQMLHQLYVENPSLATSPSLRINSGGTV